MESHKYVLKAGQTRPLMGTSSSSSSDHASGSSSFLDSFGGAQHILLILGLTLAINYFRWNFWAKEREKVKKSRKEYCDSSSVNETKVETRKLDDIEIMNKMKKPMSGEEAGGVAENYSWEQTGSEIDVKVPLPSNCMTKDIRIEIKEKWLECSFMIGDGLEKVIFDGELFRKVNLSDCGWSVADGVVWIMLKKAEETNGKGHWNCVVINDGHKIDVEKFGPILEEMDLR